MTIDVDLQDTKAVVNVLVQVLGLVGFVALLSFFATRDLIRPGPTS